MNGFAMTVKKELLDRLEKNLKNNCSGNNISILIEANAPKSIEDDLSNTSLPTIIEVHTLKCTEKDISQTHQSQKILPSLNTTPKADSGATTSSSCSTSSSKSASTDTNSSSLNETHLLLYESLVQHFKLKTNRKGKEQLKFEGTLEELQDFVSWLSI